MDWLYLTCPKLLSSFEFALAVGYALLGWFCKGPVFGYSWRVDIEYRSVHGLCLLRRRGFGELGWCEPAEP